MIPHYEEVVLLPPKHVGWFPQENRDGLDKLLMSGQVNVAIEIGSWVGLSAAFIAHRLPPRGKLYCVDLWDRLPFCEARMDEFEIKYLYQQFLSNMIHERLTDRVVPVRLGSVEASQCFTFTADLIYIDADHSAEGVCRDILAWEPHLRPGGVICGDDWGVPHFAIEQGVRMAMARLGRETNVVASGRFWELRLGRES